VLQQHAYTGNTHQASCQLPAVGMQTHHVRCCIIADCSTDKNSNVQHTLGSAHGINESLQMEQLSEEQAFVSGQAYGQQGSYNAPQYNLKYAANTVAVAADLHTRA
jgi:hypothetical protein